MRRWYSFAATLIVTPGLLIAQEAPKPPELVASTEARTPDEEKATFRLPPGFEAQLVAAEPDIAKPMNLAFDARGRLWVTSSLEYPFPAKEGETPRDRVTVLADFGDDGRARSITQFAEGLNIPIGVLPTSTSEALVHSIPQILRLVDSDGDGRADRREVAYEKVGFVDTHGMVSAFTIGFDGWVYACHGFSNASEIKGSDGEPVVMQSGNTWRFRADGSHAEQRTWGQVNPFGLAFDPLGNLYSADCHSRPLYQLLAGGYYPSFGKPDDGLGFAPEMCPHDHGSTGIGGVVHYAAGHFPPAFRDNVFLGNPVTSRINRDTLGWTGSSPRAIEQPDLLVSDDPWFRPVDLELGPDGALYVADFYNKIIGHYEVPLTHPGRDRDRGRIWRIVYKGTDGQRPSPAMPRVDWTSASLFDLVLDLGHPNLAVRMRATHELADRRSPETIAAARSALADISSPERRAHALWVLERLGASGDHLAAAASDPDRFVRTHALKALGEHSTLPDDEQAIALKSLGDEDAFVRRAAAEALSRHVAEANLRPLLDLARDVDPADTHLRHVARMSLRDQLRPAESWSRLPSPLSDRDRMALADVAPGVPSPEAAGYLLEYIEGVETPDSEIERFVQHIARYGPEGSAATLLEYSKARRPDDLGHQVALLRSFDRGLQGRGAAISEDGIAWASGLARRLLESGRPDQVQTGIDVVATVRLAELAPDLVELAVDRSGLESLRLAALDARVALDPSGAVGLAAALLDAAEEPAAVRDRSAEALGRIDRDEARAALLATLPIAPAGLQRTLAASLSATKTGAEALVAAVEAGKASPRVLQDQPVPIRLSNAGIDQARIDALTADLPSASEAMQAIIDRRRASFQDLERAQGLDPARGLALYEKTCAACHRIGATGAKIGPQLDGVGARGLDRLLEDVNDPNRNVDQAFRTTNLALADGRVLSGLLLREEGDVLVMADSKGKEQLVPKGEVEDRKVVPLSPMPADIVEPLSDEEFAQLIGYLLSQRAQPVAE